jgi:tetratricopeptide (TPR) repeat protein
MRSSTLLTAFLLFYVFSFPGSPLASEKGIWVTDELQLRLADAFMDESEYYRSITEYKKFLILFPESDRIDYALFKMGLAYYRSEEYEASARTLSGLGEKFPESGYAPEARYMEGLSYRMLGRPANAKTVLEGVAVAYPDSEYAPLARVAVAMLALEQDQVNESRQELERLLEAYPDHPGASRVRQTFALFDQYQGLSRKSETLAGIMSTVLPGSGYIYAEHYGDGITAFLISALSIAGAVTAVHHENFAVAGIVGGIGLPFYFGNIYGSANAAKKWNIGVRKDLRSKIFITLDFDF